MSSHYIVEVAVLKIIFIRGYLSTTLQWFLIQSKKLLRLGVISNLQGNKKSYVFQQFKYFRTVKECISCKDRHDMGKLIQVIFWTITNGNFI